jgi:hypothetical protein
LDGELGDPPVAWASISIGSANMINVVNHNVNFFMDDLPLNGEPLKADYYTRSGGCESFHGPFC